VNNELIATWGNLVNRVVSFAYSRFDGAVPTPGPRGATDERLLAEIRAGFASVGDLYAAVKLKAAATEARRLSQLVNVYVTERAPFSLIKTDRAAAATVVHTALQAIAWLNTLWAPILPHASQAVHAMLGFPGALFGRQYTETVRDGRGEHLVLRYDHSGAIGRWAPVALPGGQPLGQPAALFTKLDPATAERESASP
jgi:methionyl-tRNA synthetase